MNPVVLAFGLTLFAGLATGLGSIIAFAYRKPNYRFLSIATGVSAGVMLYVSFVEIIPKGSDSLAAVYGEVLGDWINVASFFGGMLLIGLIDHLIPSAENPHEVHSPDETAPLADPDAPLPDFTVGDETRHQVAGPGAHDHRGDHHKLMRVGVFTAIAITIHNFPEGLATFLAALEDPKLGVAIAIAIALHNIPEGISVSVPIFYATGDRKKAFGLSLLSGLAEPVGAAVAYVALSLLSGGQGTVIPPGVMGVLFGGVAGIMVYISVDELLPTSRAYGKGHDSLFGLVAGMAIMALSLLIMKSV
ncbi:MAG: zinc transporter ZupT [Armatimonadetes bacterium]|nr:zinc transporter ZupT [Armatimonadota bacterium]